jgi:formylglycine-generating enzyme required for sulfatase activity
MAHEIWTSIKDSGNRQLIENFSSRFADTPYALAAQAQLSMLTPKPPRSEMPETNKPAKEIIDTTSKMRIFGPHAMVPIKGDCYWMGSKPGYGSESDEKYHQVCVKDFMIDRYEVTFEAYDNFANDTGRKLPGDEKMGRGSRPVINVDWKDARSYAEWASRKYGAKFRLPTEAEWEYACRGSDIDSKFCGGNDAQNVAVHNAESTMPVGSKSPNSIGLYDMSGNAWEMTCSPYDWEHNSIAHAMQMGEYDGGEVKCLEDNPNGTDISFVFRGGSWEGSDRDIRAANRRVNVSASVWTYLEHDTISNLGFRLVADP